MKLKLGTRRSLLAWTQSSAVAKEVERLNPGVQVELIGIETQGDRITDIPLSKIEGKEFFVAELDQALRSGKVDFTVHSMKDLSLERPPEFTLAAIPKRENPRDVILFSPHILERLKSGAKLRVGTSSPRRLENIPAFLSRALPQVSEAQVELKMEFVEIRGNVNTRIQRLHEEPTSENGRYLDAVVLAFAGLIRLMPSPEFCALLKDLRLMVLPLSECPAAPAQGALAVEARRADDSICQILKKLHDALTESAVRVEREILAESGGGCHQRFGATQIQHPHLGPLVFVKGKMGSKSVNELRWEIPESSGPPLGSNVDSKQVWDGTRYREFIFENEPLSSATAILNPYALKAVFLAHSRALPESWENQLSRARVWTAGVESWFRLAQKGIWVEGCSEGLGFEFIRESLKEPFLGLPPLQEWHLLTHEGATEASSKKPESPQGLATYRLKPKSESYPEFIEKIKTAQWLYWSSGSQFKFLGKWANPKAHHACGPGSTADLLKNEGVQKLQVFPSVKEWRKWLKLNPSSI